jgi:hypothetical protein
MSKKNVQFANEIESTSDALQFFRIKKSQGSNINITKIGEVQYEVEVPGKGKIHLNDNCRKLPKEQRNMVKFWIFCLGFTVIAILSAPIWLPEILKVLAG